MNENPNNKQELDELIDEITARRSEVVQGFKVDFSVDDIPDVESDSAVQDTETTEESSEVLEEPIMVSLSSVQQSHRKEKKQKAPRTKLEGCLLKIIYAIVVLAIAGALAAVVLVFVLDSMAFNRNKGIVDVEIEKGSNTEQIANILVDKGLIDNAFCFRIYARISGADNKWQVGAFTLSPDMGYATLVETLQTMTPRETVRVTIPEGFTVEEMAQLLEEKGACAADSFYEAVVRGEYDYDFIKAIPSAADGEEHKGRIYRLEGYLFPDTYEFYVGSSGETVVGRMLENFDKKLTPKIREKIAAKGWTIDEAIIIASLIEGEAATKEDMEKVSKVLANRMEPNSGFPKLELCSTRDYVKGILPTIPGIPVTSIAYNTYEREGLPVGAINNPGMQAIKAALNPSKDEEVENCYFFATDYDTEITYFSQTFAEHERICRKYGIGAYG